MVLGVRAGQFSPPIYSHDRRSFRVATKLFDQAIERGYIGKANVSLRFAIQDYPLSVLVQLADLPLRPVFFVDVMELVQRR